MSTESTLPEFAQWADWIDGRLSAEESARMAKLFEIADQNTRATVTWLQAFSNARRYAALATPTLEARAGAMRAFADRTAATPGLLRRIVARLTPAPRLAGVRSSAAQTERHLTFSSAELDVLLDIIERREDGRFDMSGQVFVQTGLEVFTVQLLRDQLEQGIATSSEFGEFSFSALSEGEYGLIVRIQQLEVELAPVLLRRES